MPLTIRKAEKALVETLDLLYDDDLYKGSSAWCEKAFHFACGSRLARVFLSSDSRSSVLSTMMGRHRWGRAFFVQKKT